MIASANPSTAPRIWAPTPPDSAAVPLGRGEQEQRGLDALAEDREEGDRGERGPR